jgi:glycosyltransferase involved in cell wall biosynthesis
VAGAVDKKSEPYLAHLKTVTADCPDIDFVVAPSDSELAALYASCRAVLFPAFNEDWGMVPLEGMAFGKPVIATNRGGPRESIRHGVDGFLEDPVPSAFAARMLDLARDERLAASLGRAAFARAGAFTWDRFVSRIDDEIDRLSGVVVQPLPTPVGSRRAAGEVTL